jgi:DNA polymerase
VLLIDFETFCLANLPNVGAYRYTEDQSFEPLLMSYMQPKHTHAEVAEGLDAILAILKTHKRFGGWGQFDRLCLRRILGHDHFVYEDIMVRAAEVGYPLKLEHAAMAAGLKVGKAKGKHLIHRFCKIYRGKRITKVEDPERWAEFVTYCRIDTEVMTGIYNKTPELSPREQRLYKIDCDITDRGVEIDIESVRLLQKLTAAAEDHLDAFVNRVTEGRVRSIGSIDKMLGWLKEQGVEIPNLQADTIDEWLSKPLPLKARQVLKARQAGAKASTKKLKKILACVCSDNYVRGMVQFCGAHTRRWAGRLIQPQNFPRDCLTEVEFDALIEAIKSNEPLFTINERFGSPLDAVSGALRGLLIAGEGHSFLVADYAAIEARILAWLAGQDDVLKIYREGGDVYKAMASMIFQKPEASITTDERFLGKTIVLGCGFMLGWKKLMNVTLPKAGIVVDQATAQGYIGAFRTRYDRVQALWTGLREGCLRVVKERIPVKLGMLTLSYKGGALIVTLPNDQKIYYHRARVDMIPPPWTTAEERETYLKETGEEVADIEAVTAMMKGQGGGFHRRPLSPGLVTENAVQAVAREVMASGMIRVEDAGIPLTLTVHDELLARVPNRLATPARLKRFEAKLVVVEPWMLGLPLAVEGKILRRYGK